MMEKLTDPLDIASELEQVFTQQALAAQLNKPKKVYTGKCHYCDEPLAIGEGELGQGIYCDADCHTDFDKMIRAERNRVR